MTKHFCDKCGAELPPDMSENVKIGLWYHYLPGDGCPEFDSYGSFRYDVCNACAGKLTEFISGVNEAETPRNSRN